MSVPTAAGPAERTYRLLRTAPAGLVGVADLDAAQRAVVGHRGGPLLVLAGPGTGKTTTLVESVVARLDGSSGAPPLRPDQVLVLTFGRAAAAEVRDRIGARLAGAVVAPTTMTFHAFGYALVRQYEPPDRFAEPLRLLSGPEQDVLVRELVAGSVAEHSLDWPADLRAALGTRGFADELRDLLARARELALDPVDLRAAARRAARADWQAAAGFFHEYLDVLGHEGALDYAELLHRAALLAERPEVSAELRGRYRAVFVDEYQDTDPTQVRLLRALAGDGHDLVVFGDPDQSIYAFRGADVNGILDFADTFRRADGERAGIVALRDSRRAGAELLAASRRLASRMPIRRLPAEAVREHRALRAAAPSLGGPGDGGDVRVLTYPTERGQLDAIVDLLRRAHLEDGVPWQEMAVLVRSASRSLPPLRRVLVAGGVPVHCDGDEVPLAAEPAVVALLDALRWADALRERRESAAIEDDRTGAPEHALPAQRPGPAAITMPRGFEAAGLVGTAADTGRRAGRPDTAAAATPADAAGGDAGRHAARDAADTAVLATGVPDATGGGEASRDGADSAARDVASAGDAGPEDGVPGMTGGAGAGVGAVDAFGEARDEGGTAAAPASPALSVDAARRLLTGPLGGLDAADLRRLARELRAEERAALSAGASDGSAPRGVPHGSEELLRDALVDPARLAALDRHVAGAAWRLGRLLTAAAEELHAGGGVESVLWLLWHGVETPADEADAGPGTEPAGPDEAVSPDAAPRGGRRAGRRGTRLATGWPERLEWTARRGGAAARAADRDLDAICVLFDYAERVAERSGERGVRNFIAELEAQRIAGATLAARAARGGAVELTSAHRSKGRQWRVVVVADVQHGLWPDLRPRGSLLQADRVAAAARPEAAEPGGGPAEPGGAVARAALLAEERRLFYVAVTRARQRLVVTAVDSALGGSDDGEAPSRFLGELGVDVRPGHAVRRRPLTVAALVAELRARLVDPKASDALRGAAARRLAELAAARDEDGLPLVRAAHPASWWGMAELTAAGVPVRPPDQPLRMSASQVSALDDCALRWFFGHEARAEAPSSAAQSFGNIVHALVDEVAKGEAPADLDVLMDRLDRVWPRIAFEAPWQSARQRDEAREALERFLAWHVAERGRALLTSEHGFDVTLRTGGYQVRVAGTIDRAETGPQGQVYLVDFKTGRHPETKEQAARHPQLAVYQLVAGAGGLDDTGAAEHPVGGAELVYLSKGRADGQPTVLEQPPLGGDLPGAPSEPSDTVSDATSDATSGSGSDPAPGEGTWAERLLAEVAARVLDERFDAYGRTNCDRCEFRRACPKRAEGRHLPA